MTTGFSYMALFSIPIFSGKVFNIYKNKYLKSRAKYPVPSPFKEKKLKVAALVKRGSFTYWMQTRKKRKNWDITSRWTDNSWFADILIKINRKFGEDRVDIHIYSDAQDIGELRDFGEFRNATIHLQKDDPGNQPFQAFDALATADISVLSKSSFCGLAGIVSDGIKIMPSERSSVSGKFIRLGPGSSLDIEIVSKMRSGKCPE
jgi:hypothetical protein